MNSSVRNVLLNVMNQCSQETHKINVVAQKVYSQNFSGGPSYQVAEDPIHYFCQRDIFWQLNNKFFSFQVAPDKS